MKANNHYNSNLHYNTNTNHHNSIHHYYLEAMARTHTRSLPVHLHGKTAGQYQVVLVIPHPCLSQALLFTHLQLLVAIPNKLVAIPNNRV